MMRRIETEQNCRGDLRSPACMQLVFCQFADKWQPCHIVLRGRPQVAPTADLRTDDIRPGMARQSVQPARVVEDADPYDGVRRTYVGRIVSAS